MLRARFIILSLTACLIGFILLFIYAIGQEFFANWFNSVIQELASVLIISGSVSALSSYFTTIEFVNELHKTEERIRNSQFTNDRLGRLGNVGIVDAYADATRYDFTSFIQEADSLIICLNDGKSWLSNNLNEIRRHMSRPSSETIFILVDPDGEYVKVLAQRTNQKIEYQADKIRDTCKRLVELHNSLEGDSKRKIKIFFHDLPAVRSVFLSEDKAIVSEYTTSRPRIAVPLLITAAVGEGSYYHFIKADINNLMTDQNATRLMFHVEDGQILIHL